MFETAQIILTSAVCYGIYKIAYERGYDAGHHIGFTAGLWKSSERKNIQKQIVRPSIRKVEKQYSLVD
jgi:hypothetical protein